MKRFLLAAGAFALLTFVAPMPARAHTDFSFSFGFPGFALFAPPPPPVVYYPRPAYYTPAPYYAPAPVYYTPARYYGGRPCHHGYGHYRGWHGR
jgi:hypothetical protein